MYKSFHIHILRAGLFFAFVIIPSVLQLIHYITLLATQYRYVLLDYITQKYYVILLVVIISPILPLRLLQLLIIHSNCSNIIKQKP